MNSFALRKAREQTERRTSDVEPPPRTKIAGDSGKVIVVVDPYSTGVCVAQEAIKRGYKVVVAWTKGIGENKTHIPASCADVPAQYYAEVDEKDSLTEMAIAVHEAAEPYGVAACVCGGESGVAYCDALSEKLEVRSNGTDIPHRRDKKLQQELVKGAGLRSVRQAGGANFSDVEEFLRTETFPVVVKPVESAGSDGVKLCHSFEEAKEHFNILMNSQQRVGGDGCHGAVLCQEFLRGKEYVVDHVSRDGVHKTTMCWVYDKRPANGAAFVYYGCIPVDAESEDGKIIIPYIRGVLDAMGLKNGPSHGEVMMTDDGPCLVEMNCRCHGGDGNWVPLGRGLTGGYSQVDVTIDAYMDEERFHAIPDKMPSPFKASGQECILVSYSKGTVKETQGYGVIKCLPSFLCLETRTVPGSEVDYSTDLFTDIGSVILMHQDEEVVKKDVAFIRYLEEINGFFTYETKQEVLSRPKADLIALPPRHTKAPKSPQTAKKPSHRRAFTSDGPHLVRHLSLDRPDMRPLVRQMTTVDASKEVVVVVDPYSTGSCISKELINRTYSVIAVWSSKRTPAMMEQAPLGCSDIRYHAELYEKDSLLETVSDIQKAANLLRVVACVCGGESGVELTNAVAEKLSLRGNGTAIQRSNKTVQYDLVGASGLRAPRQKEGKTFSQLESFLESESFPVVVKPVESIGFDAAKLCHNADEAREHFELLQIALKDQGREGTGILCQEFLRGREYLVDCVSRDGQHKKVMVWLHDKRPANGSSMVYFGLVPVDPDSAEAKLVVSYTEAVLTTLDMKNGPTHTSVMMTDSGPCIIEVKCNVHGRNGIWQPLTRALAGGCTQVTATVDAYLDKQHFSAIPDTVGPFKASGQEVILVSYSRGVVKATPGFEVIQNLCSFVYMETGVKVGSEVDHTVDPFTNIGSVMLMHTDKMILEEDISRIRKMEEENSIFEYDAGVEIMRSPSTSHLSSLSRASVSEDAPKQFFASSRSSVFW